MTETSKKIDALMAQEENVLSSAVARTMQAYNQNSIVANLKDYQAAKTALEEFRKKKHAAENPEEACFSVPEAVEYLKGQGFKIEKSKLYEEKNIVGYTTIDNAVTFLKKDLDKYAKKYLDKLDGSGYETDPAGKNEQETRLTKAKADKEELLLKVLGKSYVDIAQVERTRTAQTARLLLTYENLVYGKVEKLIELVSGDMTKKHELQTFLLGDQWFRGALREFAKKDRFVFSLPTKKMLETIELFHDTEDTNAV